VLVVSGTNSFAQYEWTKYSANPLNIHGTSGSWDESIVTPCVIFNPDSNRYEMWFGTFNGTYPNNGIGFAWSTDGITWTKHPTAVMTPSATGWDSLSVGECSVIKEGNLYKMWYTGHQNTSRTPSYIGYATSTDGGITWEKYSSNPVLSPGSGWESARVEFPSVIKVTGGYWMFYTGELSHGIARTGRAFSTDGINWQKDTVNNPVLLPGASGEWDQNNYLGNVIGLNNTLYIYYTAETNPGVGGTAIGVAASTDMGITWTKYAGNPIIQRGATGQWDNGWIETGCAVFAQNQLKLFYDGGGAATGWLGRIGLAISNPLPAGTYTIGTGGNFATIQEAFDKLEADGIAGPVTLELIDNLYIAPTGLYGYVLNGPISGAGSASRVTLRPADNMDVTIQGDGEAVLVFNDVSYLTIDGINLQGATRLKVHAFYNNQGTQWNDAIDFYGNSDYVQVKNLTASSDDISRYSAGIFFSQKNQSAPDSGLVSGVFVPVANAGIYLLGDGTYNPTGFVISNNHMGSPNDSLSSWGIQNQTADGTIIENNHIENMRKGNFFYGLYFIYGIQSFNSDNVIIRNNVVHNIVATNGPTRLQGIFVSGDVGERGSNNWIYNNMVYDIRTSVSNVEWLAGIFVGDHNNPKIEFNSVNLTEGNDNSPTSGSAAVWIHPTVTSPTIRNNILVNTRDESPYCASTIYAATSTNLTSDYNDLFYQTNQYNCLVRIGSTKYHTLADWQATGKDQHSLNEIANFISPTDLHINNNYNTLLDGRATPIAGITLDFDGETRNTTSPDIGADEFDLNPNASNWQMQNSNFPSDVMIINFSAVDNQTCWAIGQKIPPNTTPYSGFIKTTNGGTSWSLNTIQGITNGYLDEIFALDANTAYVTCYKLVGTTGTVGIYKTTDGGTTWNRQNAYNSSQTGPAYIYFFDSQNGVVIGDYLETYTTTNGGENWNAVTMPTPLTDEWTYLGENRFEVIGNTVWFCTNKGRVLKSTDKGYTWNIIFTESQYYDWMPSIAFQNEDIGIYSLKEAGNATNHIYRKTIDGGAHWSVITNSVLDNLAPSGLQHIPGSVSTYVVTGGRQSLMRGFAVSYDAGESWTKIDTLGNVYVSFASDVKGWGSQFGSNLLYSYVGPRITTVEEEIIDLVPTVYSLSQNYPNPFNPSTTFRYSIPTQSKVVIKVFDILGNEIATLMDEEKSVGTYELTWYAVNLPSGVYFYQLKAGDFTSVKKMILLK